MAVRGGLRERKKRETREAIEAAALSLFERQGFERTTVDEIAAEAGISPRTFFRYFSSKEAVVLPDPRPRMQVTIEALRSQPPGPPEARLAAAMIAFAHWLEKNDDGAAARVRIMRGNPGLVSRSLLQSAVAQDALADTLAEMEGHEAPQLRHPPLAGRGPDPAAARSGAPRVHHHRVGGGLVAEPDFLHHPYGSCRNPGFRCRHD